MTRVLLGMLVVVTVASTAQAANGQSLPSAQNAPEIRGTCTVTRDGKTTVSRDRTIPECMKESGTWSAEPAAKPDEQKSDKAGKAESAKARAPGEKL